MPELRWLAETSIEHLRLALEVGGIGVWELDLESGLAWRNQRHDEIFGYRPGELEQWSFDQFLSHVAPADRDRVARLQTSAIEHEQPWVFECDIVRKDGTRRVISAAGRPLANDQGAVAKLIGHVIDITETKQNEDRLSLVTAELNHRVRNMLAMIRAMISLSSKKASNVGDFAESLVGRVGALARTHDLLVANEDRPFDVVEIVEAELAAFEEFHSRLDLVLHAQPILRGMKAESLALIIHELLTNAIKYGALSNESGAIRLEVSQADGTIVLDWHETGGPILSDSIEPGFGTRMMNSMLGHSGKVALDFRREGLVCRITMAA